MVLEPRSSVARGESARIPAGVLKVLGSRALPDESWVAQVAGCSVSRAEGAVARLGRLSRVVDELVEKIERTGRSYYAQFPAPLDLYALVRLAKPANVIESGVSSGVSTTFLLLGIKSNGRGILHSIDLPVERRGGKGNESWAIPPGLISGWAVPPRLKRGWDLRLGRSEDLLKPLLAETGVLGFYCHDSPVDARHFEFEMDAIRGHLRPGSLVVADNTEWKTFEATAESVGASPIRRRKSSLAAFRVP
jgi:hypothetical protein